MTTDEHNTHANDRTILRAEQWIRFVLRAGVAFSVTLILCGLSITFFHHPQYMSADSELAKVVAPGAAFPRTLAEVFHGVMECQGRAITVCGLLTLIATPILRVAISIAAFLEQRDLRFVLITTIVLVLLLLSLSLGHAE